MEGNPARLRQGRKTQTASARGEQASQLAAIQGQGRVRVLVQMDEPGSSSGSRSRLARVSSSHQEVITDVERRRGKEDEVIPDVERRRREEEEVIPDVEL